MDPLGLKTWLQSVVPSELLQGTVLEIEHEEQESAIQEEYQAALRERERIKARRDKEQVTRFLHSKRDLKEIKRLEREAAGLDSDFVGVMDRRIDADEYLSMAEQMRDSTIYQLQALSPEGLRNKTREIIDKLTNHGTSRKKLREMRKEFFEEQERITRSQLESYDGRMSRGEKNYILERLRLAEESLSKGRDLYFPERHLFEYFTEFFAPVRDSHLLFLANMHERIREYQRLQKESELEKETDEIMKAAAEKRLERLDVITESDSPIVGLSEEKRKELFKEVYSNPDFRQVYKAYVKAARVTQDLPEELQGEEFHQLFSRSVKTAMAQKKYRAEKRSYLAREDRWDIPTRETDEAAPFVETTLQHLVSGCDMSEKLKDQFGWAYILFTIDNEIRRNEEGSPLTLGELFHIEDEKYIAKVKMEYYTLGERYFITCRNIGINLGGAAKGMVGRLKDLVLGYFRKD